MVSLDELNAAVVVIAGRIVIQSDGVVLLVKKVKKLNAVDGIPKRRRYEI